MKSICFLIENINRFAGTEKATLDLAENLYDICNFKISIISVISNKSEREFPKHIKIYHLNNNRRFFKKIKFLKESVNEILKKEKIDYLVSTGHNFSCLILPKFRKRLKTIAIEHISTDLIEKHYRLLQRLFYPCLDKIVVLTPDQIEKYKFSHNKIVCIPNSISKIDVKNTPENIIFSAGRLEYIKGFDILISAINLIKHELKNYEIRICGDGSQKENLQQQILSFGLEKIVKLLPNHDLHEEWSKAKLFILSSRTEPFGLAVAEAASVGIPCIAFKSSGPEFIFRSTKTVLIEQNANILAQRILELVSDNKLLEKNKLECLAAVSNFTPEKITNLWRENVFTN